MTILYWDKPTDSREDAFRWKAKLIDIDGSCYVAIRKMTHNHTNILVTVDSAEISIGANGTAWFTYAEWQEFNQAIAEAHAVLEAL